MSIPEKVRKLELDAEEAVVYADIEDLRQEVLERQNRMNRAVARELREIRNNNGEK